jgi:hypothetical protein
MRITFNKTIFCGTVNFVLTFSPENFQTYFLVNEKYFRSFRTIFWFGKYKLSCDIHSLHVIGDTSLICIPIRKNKNPATTRTMKNQESSRQANTVVTQT